MLVKRVGVVLVAAWALGLAACASDPFKAGSGAPAAADQIADLQTRLAAAEKRNAALAVEVARLSAAAPAAAVETAAVAKAEAPALGPAVPRKRLSSARCFGHLDGGKADAGWLEMLCAADADRPMVRDIQTALLKAGHNPGPVDGIIGPLTRGALEGFQLKEGLNVGEITRETIEALGLEMPTTA